MVNNETNRLEEQRKKKKPSPVRRIAALLAVALIVLAVAVFSSMADSNKFPALRRYLMYGDSAQTQELYTYASHPRNLYERLGEELLVVNPQGIRLLHKDGRALYELEVSMDAPGVSVGKTLAAVCDAQNGTVYVLDSTGLRWKHQSADGLLCYCARLNENDYLAVTEQKNGYKASVSVYNSRGEVIFRFDSHDNYISDAVVTSGGTHLVVTALGESTGTFTTTFIVYDLATAQRIGEYPVSDALAIELALTGDRIVALCDERLVITALDGTTKLNYAYGNEYLHNYALTGTDFCALLMSKYRSSNVCRLTTFSLDGETLATLELTEEVLAMSAAGDRLAVLYGETLVLYDRALNEVARLEDTQHAGGVRMAEDGTALLIAETSARRFLP